MKYTETTVIKINGEQHYTIVEVARLLGLTERAVRAFAANIRPKHPIIYKNKVSYFPETLVEAYRKEIENRTQQADQGYLEGMTRNTMDLAVKEFVVSARVDGASDEENVPDQVEIAFDPSLSPEQVRDVLSELSHSGKHSAISHRRRHHGRHTQFHHSNSLCTTLVRFVILQAWEQGEKRQRHQQDPFARA